MPLGGGLLHYFHVSHCLTHLAFTSERLLRALFEEG